MSLTINPSQMAERSDFISKVYTMLGISLLLCAIGAFFGTAMPPSFFWPIVIAEFIVLIACQFLHRSFPLNILLLAGFAMLSGLTLGPVLNYYVAMGMGDLIPMAAGSTAVVFGGLSTYAHLSKKDFSFLGGFLFVALIGLLVTNLLGWLFHFHINDTLYASVGVIIFSGYILYDTSNLLHRYQDDQYVAATIALYLDIINLFLMILRLLGSRRR